MDKNHEIIFIDNNNTSNRDSYRDGFHLLERCKRFLANNFISVLNNILNL